MKLGQPVADSTGRMGSVVQIGPAGPDNNRLVTVEWDGGNRSYAWRTEFEATDLRVAAGLVWRVTAR